MPGLVIPTRDLEDTVAVTMINGTSEEIALKSLTSSDHAPMSVLSDSTQTSKKFVITLPTMPTIPLMKMKQTITKACNNVAKSAWQNTIHGIKYVVDEAPDAIEYGLERSMHYAYVGAILFRDHTIGVPINPKKQFDNQHRSHWNALPSSAKILPITETTTEMAERLKKANKKKELTLEEILEKENQQKIADAQQGTDDEGITGRNGERRGSIDSQDSKGSLSTGDGMSVNRNVDEDISTEGSASATTVTTTVAEARKKRKADRSKRKRARMNWQEYLYDIFLSNLLGKVKRKETLMEKKAREEREKSKVIILVLFVL